MLVQRVLMPASGRESWTLLGEDGEVVEPAERYLACLAAVERSPHTVGVDDDRCLGVQIREFCVRMVLARPLPLDRGLSGVHGRRR